MRVTQPLLRNQQQRPTAIASIDGHRTYTWDELVSRIARLASGLKALGLKEKDRVGVLALNSDRYMELLFAVPWAGGIVVPLNHRWSSAEIAFAVADSDTRIICVDETFENTALEVVESVDHQLQIIGIDGSVKSAKTHVDGLADKQTECPEKQSSQDDVSGIFYTGGTTGRSKGVMLTHGNHVSNTLQFLSIIDMTEESVYLHAAPMFHIADALYVYMVTHIGGKHIFIPRFEPALCAQAIQDHKISDIILVPTMIQMLLEQPNFKDFDFSSLQRLYYGASPMPEAVAHDLVNKFPWVKCFQLYGQTESAPLLTALDSKYHNTSNQNQGRMKSAGRAMPAVELKIVDEVIPEPVGGAHRDKNLIIDNVRNSIRKNLDYFKTMNKEEIFLQRKNKFLSIGRNQGFAPNSKVSENLSMNTNIINKFINKISNYKKYLIYVLFFTILVFILFAIS
mgnify:CR=1 FL=1